jgi:hypothetical protein
MNESQKSNVTRRRVKWNSEQSEDVNFRCENPIQIRVNVLFQHPVAFTHRATHFLRSLTQLCLQLLQLKLTIKLKLNCAAFSAILMLMMMIIIIISKAIPVTGREGLKGLRCRGSHIV